MATYGRYQVAEPPSALLSMHLHSGAKLKPVEWDIPIAVLDQEDLHAQGIFCSKFIPGAGNPDALGSCVANTGIEQASHLLSKPQFIAFIKALTGQTSTADIYTDTVLLEKAAICLYHRITFATGNPAQEWPTVDCGSSGLYLAQILAQMGVCAGSVVASGAENIISLLQDGPLAMGGPFLNAWEEPPANGIIDLNGTSSNLAHQLRSGIAGGHETSITGVSELHLHPLTGGVDASKTLLDCLNHWTAGWGLAGRYKMHLSTVLALASQFDLRRLVPVTP